MGRRPLAWEKAPANGHQQSVHAQANRWLRRWLSRRDRRRRSSVVKRPRRAACAWAAVAFVTPAWCWLRSACVAARKLPSPCFFHFFAVLAAWSADRVPFPGRRRRPARTLELHADRCQCGTAAAPTLTSPAVPPIAWSGLNFLSRRCCLPSFDVSGGVLSAAVLRLSCSLFVLACVVSVYLSRSRIYTRWLVARTPLAVASGPPIGRSVYPSCPRRGSCLTEH